MGGLFASTGKVAVALAFTLCNTALSFASENPALVLRIFAESAFAVSIFMLIPKEAGVRLKASFSSGEERAGAEAIKTNVISRLSYASKALESVKDCVKSVADRLRERSDDKFDSVYAFAAESACKTCGLKSYCWQNQLEVTKDDFARLGEVLSLEGYVTDKTIEDKFTKKCCRSRELAKSINEGYGEYLSALEAKNRITQLRSATAGQLSSVSNLLSDLCDEFDTFECFDEGTADRLTEKLRREGFVVEDCICRVENLRGMTVELDLRLSRKKEINKSELRRLVSACCGRVFDSPCVSVSEESARLVFSQLARFDADIGSSQHIAGGKGLCGDCANYFTAFGGSMIAVISDGMGTGGRAAVDSNMAVSILKKLLQAGLSFDSALSVINASIMCKSEEESLATLDVVDINLFSGKTTFFKAGAPLTFVKRGGRVIKRESASLPAGILNDVKFAKDSLNLHHGDRILMISDGALFTDEGWIADMLKGSKTKLLDTRKTTPGMRIFEKYAVKVGGGYNHRFNLSDGILLKDNHIGAAGGVKQAVAMAKEYAPFVRKIEIEVENLDMLREALEAGADIIMLDNMSVEDMKTAVALCAGKAETECSGNVTRENVARLVDIGVDYISSGALTHSSPILDLSLKNLHAV